MQICKVNQQRTKMKRKIIILGLLSAMLNISAKFVVNKSTAHGIAGNEATVEMPARPVFITLADNIFLAIKVNRPVAVTDGDVVEFVFGKKDKLVTFHINDINQDMLDKGEADLLVMVHQDLALALKDKQLDHLIVHHPGRATTIPVKRNWQPDVYLRQFTR